MATPAPRKIKFVGKRKKAEQAQEGGAESSGQVKVVVEKEQRSGGTVYKGRIVNAIPDEILNDENLNNAIKMLPGNYNFEIHKTVHRLRQSHSKCVALQFPEGLQAYAGTIADILRRFANLEDTLILGDVTYGACCVDDFTARELGADFLVHYGHSCLVPIDVTTVNVLYVFVDIKIDLQHFVDTVVLQFQETHSDQDQDAPQNRRLALVATIQFAASLHVAAEQLQARGIRCKVPQERPLSPGEILGCTSPKLDTTQYDTLVYLADGRFHLESVMISNPGLPAFQYNPYSKAFTIETYHTDKMHELRQASIQQASSAKHVGIILGTLGRQGSPNILNHLEDVLRSRGIAYTVVLLSEIFPKKLEMFEEIDAWVQIACPRLSIDWGYAFKKPLLNPYEAEVAFGAAQWRSIYPMDFYSKTGGPWTVYHKHEAKPVPVAVDF